jgi:hypothetical protein
MARTHMHSFRVTRDIAHKANVVSKVINKSRGDLYTSLIQQAYRDVRECYPEKVDQVERELETEHV